MFGYAIKLNLRHIYRVTTAWSRQCYMHNYLQIKLSTRKFKMSNGTYSTQTNKGKKSLTLLVKAWILALAYLLIQEKEWVRNGPTIYRLSFFNKMSYGWERRLKSHPTQKGLNNNFIITMGYTMYSQMSPLSWQYIYIYIVDHAKIKNWTSWL